MAATSIRFDTGGLAVPATGETPRWGSG